MSLASRVVFGALAAGVVLATPGVASADVQACLAASEKGQKLRSQGKLREARESFVICGAESCPNLVRHDCSQWNSELAATLPTVVFGAKDRSGKDLFDVTVSMDGEVLVKKLDGKSVTVDPGKHTFKFEAPGLPPLSETDLVKEGEKARVINVTLGDAPPPSPTPTPQPAPSGEVREHSVAPWIVVGVGGAAVVAGVVIFLTAPDRPSNCDKDTQKCTRGADESAADFAKDKDRAGQADSQPILGVIVAGAGAALVAGGLLWHFLEPVGPKTGQVKLAPWTTGKSSGVGLSGTF
jgi:hypothetical protein